MSHANLSTDSSGRIFSPILSQRVERQGHSAHMATQGPKQHRKSARDTGYYSICCTAKSNALSTPQTPQTFSDHSLQQTAAHGHRLSHLKALVLGNGLLHAVLLISWDHAHAGVHGPHRAAKAREEGFHASRCLGRQFILKSFLGGLVHGTSHSTHHASHSESKR